MRDAMDHHGSHEVGIVREVLTGIKRAGADLIITYHAPDVACWMETGRWAD